MTIQELGQQIADTIKTTGLSLAKSANFFEVSAPSIPEGITKVTILAGTPTPVVSRDKISLAYAVKFDDNEGTLSKNFIFGGSYATESGAKALRELLPRVAANRLEGSTHVEHNVLVPGVGTINVVVVDSPVVLEVKTLSHPYLPVANSFKDGKVQMEMSKSESYAILA